MGWTKNRRVVKQGFPDLAYLPRERCGWDCTLACLAYPARMQLDRSVPDLNAWAARHGVPASRRYRDLGSSAMVLWHGTSRERAERVTEHGLFHKRGLWTALDPNIAHLFCRNRSQRFGTEGAVVCIVLDAREVEPGANYDLEGSGNVLRFHHGLPPDVVEYVLVHDEVRFTGERRARRPAPWRQARFKKRSGQWVPVQKAPVMYSDTMSYSSVDEFTRICADRLETELPGPTALEVFSTLYALVRPWDALPHEDVFVLLGA